MFLKYLYNFDFIKTHKIAFGLSVLLICTSFIGLAFKGLNFGIDFTGGLLFEVKIEQKNIDTSEVREAFNQNSFKDINIQNFGKNGLMIRVSQDELSKKSESNKVGREKTINSVKKILNDLYGDNVVYDKVDFVGPQIGAELIIKGILALFCAFIAIMFYIWIRFEWQFGLGAVLALIHDVILTMGLFSWFQIEFDLTSVAAILTIVGYSINDSVVIYDRIRENLHKYKKREMPDILNISIQSTLSRTFLTAGTTIVALLALVFFGGTVLHGFSISVLFGVIIGTYSSIYISAPVLLYIKIDNIYHKKHGQIN